MNLVARVTWMYWCHFVHMGNNLGGTFVGFVFSLSVTIFSLIICSRSLILRVLFF